MKKLYTLALLCALALAAAVAAVPSTGAANESNASGPTIGAVIEEFKLPDADGKEHTLSSLKGKNGVALIFISVQCPVSNAYNERMEKLAQEYKAKGVNVVGINSNVAETPAAVKEHAAAKGLTFTVLKDPGNKIADRLGAEVTPEAYFLDASNKLIYRGRIDNSRNGDSISSTELRDAIEATLGGKPVQKAEAKAFGCSIKRAS
ncbi:MAG TPA: thioredoxin family protein [Pyrinomonadaceae bacterium]|nr:thioredoxin family protein [Pyrinomonadaceae bacterium]